MITYSNEVSVYRSTSAASHKLLTGIVEAVQGTEEFSSYFTIAGSATDVVVPLNGLTQIKALFIDGKPDGGVDNVDLLVKLTPIARTGVTASPMQVLVGSRLLLLDTQVGAVSITNLSPIAVVIQVFALGE